MDRTGLAKRILRRAARGVGNVWGRVSDRFTATWLAAAPGGALESYLVPLPTAALRRAVDASDIRQILDHRFDLLGSGPVRVGPPTTEISRLPGPARERAARVRALIDPGYAPIDWHLDFKSGHRWREGTWYRDVRFGHLRGVDVKVPWELARLQHLPRLACAYALTRAGEPGLPASDVLTREFRNQVLDFVGANPPRFGVNWTSTMDVAIRVANVLIAFDLFRSAGATFDAPFEAEFRASVEAHGLHVAREMDGDFRGNHFLADVAGLLFAAAYLPSTPRTDAWLDRAIRELVREVDHQFLPDGGSFEASTSYHRLSGEIALYATALGQAVVHRRRAKPFPDTHVERLERIVEFTAQIAKPSGRVPQIGDNDSGRFVKLDPLENELDHRSLLAAGLGLLGRQAWASGDGERPETVLLRALAGPPLRPGPSQGSPWRVDVGDAVAFERGKARLLSGLEVFTTCIPAPGLRMGGAPLRVAFPDFGLYLYRTPRFYLAVRCGPPGQDGLGGHAHNDALAVELWLDGHDWFADPGTFAYTAFPEVRNRYRSVRAHFAPQPAADLEPAGLDRNLFLLNGDSRSRCFVFCDLGFIGIHEGYGSPVVRVVEIGADEVLIQDAARPGLLRSLLDGPPGPNSPNPGRVPFSPGYGKVYEDGGSPGGV